MEDNKENNREGEEKGALSQIEWKDGESKP